MTIIDRRTFVQQITAALAWPVLPKLVVAAGIPPDLPPVGEIWLAEWQAANRIPIVDSDNLLERHILAAMRSQQSLTITYTGGASPGLKRRVRPALLYRVAGYTGVYLTGFCEVRGNIRTFRLDHVQLAS
jgi:predicted DNA-binding transcriptional regulator YafY